MWLELELRAGKKKGPETSHCKNRHLGTSQSHSRRNGQKTARGVRQRPVRNEMREMRGFQAASPPRPSLPRSPPEALRSCREHGAPSRDGDVVLWAAVTALTAESVPRASRASAVAGSPPTWGQRPSLRRLGPRGCWASGGRASSSATLSGARTLLGTAHNVGGARTGG